MTQHAHRLYEVDIETRYNYRVKGSTRIGRGGSVDLSCGSAASSLVWDGFESQTANLYVAFKIVLTCHDITQKT